MTHTFKEGASRFGYFYPKNCVVAVMPDAQSAHDAVDALRNRGFSDDELHIWDAPELLGEEPTFTDDRSLLEKVGAAFSDEETWMKEYREYVSQGQPLLTIYAEDDNRVEAIQPVLEQYGGGKMRYYGNDAVVRDLVKGKAPDY